ncbi:tetratricopeptide repeat protein [Pseudoalteromonas sp. MEBiC 03607]|uniref:cellulose synthase subunit BcsC-related outer membrane protein n=1 Tax=Pseudoalteromonas sp. MEBiC 03607 TaxID=2563601 RepID=UPI00109365E0|nr:cellulose synthase subunit BcsC-related outer membrane protein [Pseudoalteromonas sp. MEBiC 03607]TGV21071.1 tetratricopeptide repeat protein [Pseudoalteromonas sp. MEBiC 03607]
MPIKWLLAVFLASSSAFAATNKDLNTQSIDWLISQIHLGEVERDTQLMSDSLEKLLSIAPQNPQVKCAEIRVLYALKETTKARSRLSELSEKSHPCVANIALLIRVDNEDKAVIQQARLRARAGQYIEAVKIYNRLFKSTYPSIEFELEHINWLAQDDEQYEYALNGYRSLMSRYPHSGRIELAYARHLLSKNPTNKQGLDLLSHYAHSNFYSVEAESAWLSTLKAMPLDKNTLHAYEQYLDAFPLSSKGKLQFNDFKKDYQAELKKQADPAFKTWQKGSVELEKQNFTKAEALFKRALQGRPDDPEIYNSLGLLNLRQGRNANAYQYFKKAQKYSIDANRITVLKGLANTARFWQYIDEAKSAISSNELKQADLKLDLADTLNEDPNTVLFYRAELAKQAGQYQNAMNLYKQVLKDDPLQQPTLRAMLELTASDGNYARSHQFYNGLTRQQQALVAEDYTLLQTQQLRARADELTAQGKLDEAVDVLLVAIKQSPRQSWLYYDLANLYQQQGLVDHAKALYKKTLWQFPLDAELRYSHALFLRSLNDYQGALATLDYIPNNARTEQINVLTEQLSINTKLERLSVNNTETNKATMIYKLTELEAQPLTPLMQAELASQWQQINEQQYAIRQLKRALTRDPSLSPYWHMTYANWLIESNDKNAAESWFADYQLPRNATDADQSQWLALQVSYINRFIDNNHRVAKLSELATQYPDNSELAEALINAHIEQGNNKEAITRFEQHTAKGQTVSTDTALAIAALARQQQRDDLADRIIAGQINQVSTEQSYRQQQLMTALEQFTDTQSAINLAEQLLAKSNNNQELYYQAAAVAQAKQQTTLAQSWYRAAVDKKTATSNLTDEQNYELYALDENEAWYVNNAKRQLQSIERDEQAYITAAINLSSQTSTQNESTLGAGATPIEAGFPLWGGTGIVKLDPMTISSQETRFDQTFAGSRYGQGALCIFDCPFLTIKPEQQGTDIGLAWQNEQWRFDIGTTPLGFLVEDIVWGVNYKGDLGDFGYGVTFNKRPVTSSVLSYAGLEDVFTNQVWGGVRATQLQLSLSHDLGLDWGFWASTNYQILQGKNVKDNQSYSLMGGSYYRYIREINTELSLGLNLLHWSYKYNLSEETWGHGGYYSPQNYLGASLPVIFDKRVGHNFIYRLRAGVSWSTTTTDDIAFFPNDPILQGQAEAQTAVTGVVPYFEGDISSGLSYNLGASFEYRFTPHWFFGGYFNLDRADFYEPNYGQLYFRYYFNPVYSELAFPGKPVVPYANY